MKSLGTNIAVEEEQKELYMSYTAYHFIKRVKRMKSILKRKRNARNKQDNYKQLENNVNSMTAGWVFVERCDKIMKDSKPVVDEECNLNINTTEDELLQVVSAKKSMSLSHITNDSKSEIEDYKKRPRRNAIFEMTCEERVGLPLVLKHHLQFKTIVNYGIL